MFTKSLAACTPLIANDGCRVFELLHSEHDPIDLPYSFAIAEVAVGEHSYRHRLRQTEVYFILEGHGLLHVDDEARELERGDAAVIPGGAVQWIENLGAGVLRFAAIVSPPWRAQDDERMEPL